MTEHDCIIEDLQQARKELSVSLAYVDQLKSELTAANKRVEEQQERIKEMREALVRVQFEIQNLPGGIDYDADPTNESPDDAVAHTGGLIYKIIRKALEE